MRDPEPPNSTGRDEASPSSTPESGDTQVDAAVIDEMPRSSPEHPDSAAPVVSQTQSSEPEATTESSDDEPPTEGPGGTSPEERGATPVAPSSQSSDAEPLGVAGEGEGASEVLLPTPRPTVVWIPFERDALQRIDEALAALARESRATLTTSHGPEPSADDPADLTDEVTADVIEVPNALVTDAPELESGEHRVPGAAEARVTGPVGDSDTAVAAPEGAPSLQPTVPALSSTGQPPHGGPDEDARAGRDAPGDERADLAVFPFFVDERPLSGLLGLFDWRSAGRFTRLVDVEGEAAGAVGHALLTLGGRTLPARRVVLLGLGPTTAFDEAAAEVAAQRIGHIVRDLRPASVLFGATTAAAMRDSLDTFLRRMLSAAEHTPVAWFVCVEPRALTRLRRRLEGHGAP